MSQAQHQAGLAAALMDEAHPGMVDRALDHGGLRGRGQVSMQCSHRKHHPLKERCRVVVPVFGGITKDPYGLHEKVCLS